MTNKAIRNIVNPKIKSQNPELSVIILSAGVGRRMRSHGTRSLLKLNNGQTVLEKQINTIKEAAPNADIIVVTGFEANKIFAKFYGQPIRQVYNDRYESTHSTHSALLGIWASINVPVILIHGDILFNKNIITELILRNKSTLVLDDKEKIEKDKVGASTQNNKIIHLSYGLSPKWAQIVLLHQKELDMFVSLNFNIMLYEALNHVIDNGGDFEYLYPKYNKLIEIDEVSQLEDY